MPTEMTVNSGFEVNTSSWESNTAFGAFVASSFARTTAKFHSGTASALVTWPAPGGGTTDSVFNHVGISGHIPGQRYKATFWVWVPTGSADVKAEVIFVATGAATSVKDNWVQISVEYVATQSQHHVGIRPSPATVSGHQVYVDDVSVMDMLVTGTWKSPLNMPPLTMQQLINRGAFKTPLSMARMEMTQLVNRGSFVTPMPRMTTDMIGTVDRPRKILIDGVLKSLVRVRWPS